MARHGHEAREVWRERCAERGAPREALVKFVLSPLLPLSLFLSLSCSKSKRLLKLLSVSVAQLVKACEIEQKVVGSIRKEAKPF